MLTVFGHVCIASINQRATLEDSALHESAFGEKRKADATGDKEKEEPQCETLAFRRR